MKTLWSERKPMADCNCQQLENQHILACAVFEGMPIFTLHIIRWLDHYHIKNILCTPRKFHIAVINVSGEKSIASTDCPLQNAKQALWFWQCLEVDFCSSLLNREVHLYASVKQAICALHPKSFHSFRPLQFFTPPPHLPSLPPPPRKGRGG